MRQAKSRVIKSALFGGGRWQILWYPNVRPPLLPPSPLDQS